MGGCTAANCTNHSRKGFRMFRFPSDAERRKKWIINCRRDNWEPSRHAQICSDHFEESQFELNRKDERKMLKRNAIPTIFNVPNPPPSESDTRIKGIGCPKPNSILAEIKMQENKVSYSELCSKIEALEKENKMLTEKIETSESKLQTFLSAEQIASLSVNKSSKSNWSEEAIIKGLKLRFALGKKGFNYLRSTGYPAPSYSTLNRRIQGIKFNFGVLDALFPLLKVKVESMDAHSKNCVLLVDEMEIASYQDFDTSTKCFVGNVTMGLPDVANHYLLVILRGISSPWKQVVAHELTGASITGLEMKNLVVKTIQMARSVGLNVRASTSDMGSNNQRLWRSLGVSVTRKQRKISYTIDESDSFCNVVYSIADVPHLLKNMRNAFLLHIFILPGDICKKYDLPSCYISSGYLKQLWMDELNNESALRCLHHLKKLHLFPSHFKLMNVALAAQLFSTQTAAAMEKAIDLKQIKEEARPTAWWIRIIAEWFEIMTARHPKKAITLKNKEKKISFLRNFIDLMQNIQIGVRGWKPLQTGMIMSTKSVIELAEELFCEGLKFFLPGRLTQDALENVFSQIRRKSGAKPSGLQAKTALKLICLSQFVSDTKNSNYSSDSDMHLLQAGLSQSELPLPHTQSLTPQFDQHIDATPSTSDSIIEIRDIESNDIFYIAGATLKAIINKKNICQICIDALKIAEDSSQPKVPEKHTILTNCCNMGGLQTPKSGIYRICCEAEKAFQKHKENFLSAQVPISDEFISNIKNFCSSVKLPSCCKITETVIDYYLIVRCKGLQSHMQNKRKINASFGSASANKKKKDR